ncbi:MAG: hypothetical protein KC561_00240 [Myxococcales bacterium]|nr:hypothetical protein [Myxococcales bacterium]
MNPQRLQREPIIALVVLLAAVALSRLGYDPAMDGELIFDDQSLLVRYECWRGIENIPNMIPGLSESNPCQYRPGRWMTFAVDYTLSGVDSTQPDWKSQISGTLHTMNWLYHLLAGGLLFLLLRRFSSPLAAAVATSIWLLHPVHADSVAYISGRRDVVSSLLVVASLLLIYWPWRGRDPDPSPSVAKRLSATAARLLIDVFGLLFATAALFTKEMAATLPALLALLFVSRLGFRRVLSLTKEHWGILGVGVGACILVLSPILSQRTHLIGFRPVPLVIGIVVVLFSILVPIRRHLTAIRTRPALFAHAMFFMLVAAVAVKFVELRAVVSSHSERLDWWGGNPVSNFATSASLIPRFVELTIWPQRLIGDYFQHTLPIQHTFLAVGPILGIAAVLLLLGVSIWFWRRGERRVGLGCGWFLVALLPVLHIFPHHELFAEHYLYLPMMGLSMASLPGIEWLAAPKSNRMVLFVVLAFALAGASTVRLYDRAWDYSTRLRFFENAQSYAPDNQRIQASIAHERVSRGLRSGDDFEFFLAEQQLTRLLQNDDLHEVLQHISLRLLVQVYENTGRQQELEQAVDQLLAAFPDDGNGIRLRAGFRLAAGDYSGAAQDYATIMSTEDGSISPEFLEQYINSLNHNGEHEAVLATVGEFGIPTAEVCPFVANSEISLQPPRLEQAIDTLLGCAERFGPSEPIVEPLYSLLGQTERFETISEVVERVTPTSNTSCRIAIEGLNRTRNWAGSLDLARTCAASFGPTGQIEALRVVALIQSGDLEAATSVLESLPELGVPSGVIDHLRSRLEAAAQPDESPESP